MELRMQDGKVSLVHAFVSPGWSLDDYPCLAFRVRRPKYRDDTATRFKLLLNVQRGPTYKILLSDAAKGRNELSLPQPLEWRANEWCTVRVNLRSLFKQQLPKVALKDLKIGSLGLECSGTNARESIHLQNFFVFAPWTPADKVRLRAFDESGIAGLEFIDGTKAGGLEFAPAAAAPATVGEGWIPAMIRDKAGNLSLPVRVPWWPAGQLEAGSPSG